MTKIKTIEKNVTVIDIMTKIDGMMINKPKKREANRILKKSWQKFLR